MSGAFGWHRNDTKSNQGTRHNNNSGFDSAYAGYGGKSNVGVRVVGQASVRTPPPSAPRKMQNLALPGTPVPTAKHALKSTAANVLIWIQDVTGSMGDWPDEIFKRLPLMYAEASKYLGSDDLEILFIAHGDARTDNYAVQVARFGKGPDLDPMLASFDRNCGGGGQGTESHELVAYYLLKQVDTSSARNVYAFFVTDEAACDSVRDDLAAEWLGLSVDPELHDTQAVFAALGQKMNVYTVLRKATGYRPGPIKAWWEKTLGRENIIPLDDHRRCVDAVLGTLAVDTGQLNQFTQDLLSRQGGTKFGDLNVKTVLHSIALVGKGTSSSPLRVPGAGTGTIPLLAAPGTKSLLD